MNRCDGDALSSGSVISFVNSFGGDALSSGSVNYFWVIGLRVFLGKFLDADGSPPLPDLISRMRVNHLRRSKSRKKTK